MISPTGAEHGAGRILLGAGLVLVALLLPAAPSLWCNTWFVAPGGSDAGDGSVDRPWSTVARALEQAQRGDSVCLRGGVFREQVTTVRDGSDGAPITLVNYPGEVPTVSGDGSNWRNGIIIAHDYFQLIGVEVRDWEDTGIWLQPHVDHILVRRCVVTDCGAGIDIYQGVHDFVIDSVDLSGFRSESHGLDMTSHDGTPIYNGLISNSKSHDGGGGNCDGFALGHRGDSNVYASFGDIRDVRLVKCEVYNVGDGFDISGRNIRLERCVAHDTYYGGNYKLWGMNSTLVNCIGYNGGVNVELDHFVPQNPDDPPGTPPPTVEMINCTFFNARSYNINLETDSCRLTMVNCVILGGNNIGINLGALLVRGIFTGDYNIFGCENSYRMFADPQIDLSLENFAAGEWTALTGQDSHSVVVFDPLTALIDTAAASINLRAPRGSPTIDAGVVLPGRTPTIDFDGNSRDAEIDIGAFEFMGTDAVPDAIDRASTAARATFRPGEDNVFLELDVPRSGNARIEIVDLSGRLVRSVGGLLGAGRARIAIPVDGLPTGFYVVIASGIGDRTVDMVHIVR